MEIALGILFVVIAAIPVVYLLNDKRLQKQKRSQPRYTKDQADRLIGNASFEGSEELIALHASLP